MGKTLYDHALFELLRAGQFADDTPDNRKIITDTLALVRRFEKQAHNTLTAKWVIDFFATVANWLPITPITDDPEEWEQYEDTHKNMKTGNEEKVTRWISTRCPSFISMDGGKSFVDLKTNEYTQSVDHVQYLKDQAELKRKRNEKPVETKPDEQPPTDTSTPAGEQ